MNEVERIAREVMGWVGCKYLSGEHPWDIGVMPETAHQDETGRPVGYDPEIAFFSPQTLGDKLLVFGPEDDHGKRGFGFFFDPFADAESAQMVLQRLGKGHIIFDILEYELAKRKGAQREAPPRGKRGGAKREGSQEKPRSLSSL